MQNLPRCGMIQTLSRALGALRRTLPQRGKGMNKNEAIFARLQRLGMDTGQALGRFMGNEELLLHFVCQLPGHLRFAEARQSLAGEDEETFYMLVHGMKGIAGNLSIEGLFDCCQAILVEFRTSRFQNGTKLAALLREAETESEALVACIRQYAQERKEAEG